MNNEKSENKKIIEIIERKKRKIILLGILGLFVIMGISISSFVMSVDKNKVKVIKSIDKDKEIKKLREELEVQKSFNKKAFN